MSGVFDKIRHDSTAVAVAEQIERLILHGILRPGDRLPAERELAVQVDVSRPILREALKALEERGLLVARHGEGTFVADIIGTVFSTPVVELIRRSPKAVADYLEFRRFIEGWSASLAAERATTADREILGHLIEAMTEAYRGGDHGREAMLDVEFHTAIGEAAHNIVLLHTLRSCYRLLADGVFAHRARIYGRDGGRAALMAQHQAIYDAILGADPADARAAAEAHIDYVAAAMAELERDSDRQHLASLRLELQARRGQDDRPKAGASRAADLATDPIEKRTA